MFGFSPAQILTALKDLAIAGLVLWLLLMVRENGKNAVTKEDFAAVQKQLAANVAQQEQWEQARQNAEAQRYAEMVDITNTIHNNRNPVRLCNSTPRPGALPGDPRSPGGTAAGQGGTDAGSGGRDIRPDINAFELKYEAALATCRSVLAQWPSTSVQR